MDLESRKREHEKTVKQNEVKDQYKLHMIKNSVTFFI